MRIRGLDGLRALSILCVVAAHVIGVRNSNQVTKALLPLGSLGVLVFFVISGFLITHLLLGESERSGGVRLGRFYVRRALRLWPALWVYLAVCVLLAAVGVIAVSGTDVVAALGFFTDYHFPTSHAITNTWSLAVEEQFYLLWPPVIALLGRRRGLRVALVGLAAGPVVRGLSYLTLARSGHPFDFGLHMHYDALAAGCLLACAWGHPELLPFRLPTSRALPWVLLGVGVLGDAEIGIRWSDLAGLSVEAVGALLLVNLATGGAFRRLLDNRVARSIGVLSYSLYLWQGLFVFSPPPFFMRHPVAGVAAAFAAAALSYLLVERPFVALRRRLRQDSTAATVVPAAPFAPAVPVPNPEPPAPPLAVSV